MAFERKVGEAGLFVNTAHPEKSDYNGQLTVQCAHCNQVTDFWMSGWRKVTKTGMKYLKLALRPKRLNEHGEAGAAGAADDGDVPF
jgi:hypothetical protein